MKSVKAIDMVFKAQPMIATLREIIKQNCDESKMGEFVAGIDGWLQDARTLMQRKASWGEICAKCRDGEIYPTDCKYFGEPDGCSLPNMEGGGK